MHSFTVPSHLATTIYWMHSNKHNQWIHHPSCVDQVILPLLRQVLVPLLGILQGLSLGNLLDMPRSRSAPVLQHSSCCIDSTRQAGNTLQP